ncbi:MAG: flagellar assembly protein FliH [Rhodocyclaceae bacterium]|jgi:flagellar assembly protein FliH|nr:flagellar assembly protein FliH [Rhodocyclaceae bacterium]
MSARGLTAWERWELASFDDKPTASTTDPAIAVSPAPTSGQVPAQPAGPTPAELELAAVRDAAYQEAFMQGKKEGFDAGHKEGYSAGHSDGEVTGRTLAETLIREQAESFALLVSQLDQDISALGHSVADELLALAMEIARKMVGHTLAVKPEVVVEIVQQALAQLPVQHVTIALHPEDASLARQYAGEILAHAGHRIHESPKLKRGDVLLDAGGSHLDATLATRWQRALDGLGPVSNWDSLPAAHHEPADKEPPLRAETSVKPEALVEPVEPAAPVIAAEAAESDEPAKP